MTFDGLIIALVALLVIGAFAICADAIGELYRDRRGDDL